MSLLYSPDVKEDLDTLNELIVRGELQQNATNLPTPEAAYDLREEAKETMKSDIMSDIMKYLEEKDKQRRTVFDIPLDNGTTRVDLTTLENSVRDSRVQVLTNTKRKEIRYKI